MKRQLAAGPVGIPCFLGLTFLGLALGSLRCARSRAEESPPSVARQDQAVAELKKAGATVVVDEKDPAKPVVKVALTGGRVNDASLEALPDLPALRQLDLIGTGVTNAGLTHLKGLTRLTDLNFAYSGRVNALDALDALVGLRALNLFGTSVDDAALAHLHGLKELRTLDLRNTQVTDAGLQHLKGLTQLRAVHLKGTKVTDAGVKDLLLALPEAKVSH